MLKKYSTVLFVAVVIIFRQRLIFQELFSLYKAKKPRSFAKLICKQCITREFSLVSDSERNREGNKVNCVTVKRFFCDGE